MSYCKHDSWMTFDGGKFCACAKCEIDPGKEIARLQSELTAARDEAEGLRGRVSELESQPVAVQLSELMRGLEIGAGMASMPPYIFYLLGKKVADQAKDATDSAILLQRAYALEAEAMEWPEDQYKECSHVRASILAAAKELKDKADELEKGHA